MQLIIDDGNQHLGGHGASDLRLHRVLGGAEEFFDSRVLLDLCEEQLDLAAIPLQGRDSRGRQGRVVGREDQGLCRLGILETDTPQILRVVHRDVKVDHRDGMTAYHTVVLVGCSRMRGSRIHATLGAPSEESACLDGQVVEYVDIAHFSAADMDKCKNISTQFQQGVHLLSSFGRAKRLTVDQAQKLIGCCRVQRVDGLGQIQVHIVVAVKFVRSAGGEIGEKAPIARLVCVGQFRSMHGVAEAHCIKLVGICAQSNFDIAQDLAPRQLRKRNDADLFRISHAMHAKVSRVAFHDAHKTRSRIKSMICANRVLPTSCVASQGIKPWKVHKNEESQFKSAPN